MSDDFFPESPPEFGKSDNKNEIPGSAEDDLDIVFYATIDTPQGEKFIPLEDAASVPDDTASAEEIRILLPAWSESTARQFARPSAPQTEFGRPKKQPLWRGCIFGAIAATIILALLGSSLFSLVWFWGLRSERVSEIAAMFNEQPGQQEVETENDSRRAFDSGAERNQAAAPALAAVPAEPVNRIVFINENRQIETINPDGSDQRQLTSDAKSYLFPAWSWDGRTIASIGSTINGAGIYVMPDEAEIEAIEEVHFSSMDSPFYLYWAPDDRQISFLANDRPNGISLNVVERDGSSAARTIATGSPMYWEWAADSRRMLVHSGSETGDSRLVLMDDFGRPVAPQVPSPGPFQTPGISPSGRFWAYSQFRSGGTTWLVVDDRQAGTDVSRRHAGLVAFNWSPVADEVAYISSDGKNTFSPWGPLRLMNAETGDVRLLSAETVLAFFWSPDGRKIATISIPDEGLFGEQFEVRNAKDRRLARFAPANAREQAAQLPPHAFRLNVIDVQSGEGLHLMETNLSPIFMTQFLPYFDQYALSHQIWSPDSTSLVLPFVEGRFSELSLVNTRNGRTTRLTGGSIGFWSRQ
jgi:TolB protein